MNKIIEYPFCILDINTANDFYWDENFSFKGESHDYWEIVCVLDGEVESVEDENVYILQRGNVVFHAPGEFHRIKSLGTSHPHVLVMTFHHSGELPKVLREGVFTLSESELCRYEKIFSECRAFMLGKTDVADGALAGLELSAFLIELSSSHTPGNISSKGKRADEYRKIVDAMQSGIEENLTLQQIATRAAVSLSNMKLLFKEFSGVSPKSYYSELRLREAIRLLDGGNSVTEVAAKLGFSSPNYFSIFFKRRTGMLPKKMKK